MFLEAEQTSFIPGLHQLVDQGGGRGEAQISLREFLSWIGIDNPDALRRQSRYLDQVRRAIEALDKAWIPIYNPITNEHRIERVVLVQGLPTSRGALEKSVTIYISQLPPGSENGPLIPPTLRTWGKRSAGAYRLLLNLCYNWFRPGVTRRPASQPGRKEFWYQSQNPDDYEPMTPSEVLRMAFPNSGGGGGESERDDLQGDESSQGPGQRRRRTDNDDHPGADHHASNFGRGQRRYAGHGVVHRARTIPVILPYQ